MVFAYTPRLTARRPGAWSLASLTLGVAAVAVAGCSHSMSAGGTPAPMGNMSTNAPSPDPRIGLRAGKYDAAEAAWNLRVVSKTPPPAAFVDQVNSDLAFTGPYVIQGSFNGYQVWDISNPAAPTIKTAFVCPASQSDVSVYKNLLFVSGEGLSGRVDCGTTGVKDVVSTDRLRGLRIFDISDISHPKNVGNVQTCRGSHTHSVLVDPKDPDNVYVYISGAAGVRSAAELPGCVDAAPSTDPNSALFRIEIIKVPVAHPEQAAIVSSPRIFNDLMAPARHGDAPEDIAARAKTGEAPAPVVVPTGPQPGPTQCHDITLYPAVGLAGGACGGYGLLLDIRDPAHPVRIAAAADSNFSYWHSATFNNDASKVLFSDEWGGGMQAKCRVTDKREWGADAIFTIVDRKLDFKSYYKLPAPQTSEENCVAHNGSLIPIPGRDVMAQSWYQGGISVFDWTDASHPREIAFFDRGPVDSTRNVLAGSWSVYWYNGVLVSSEIVRGLDIFELVPSGFVSQNEIDAAKLVHFDYLNTQGQPHLVWPAAFPVARSYVDQLARSNGLSSARVSAVRQALTTAERASGTQRGSSLTALASQLDGDAAGSSDAAKVRLLAATVREMAAAAR